LDDVINGKVIVSNKYIIDLINLISCNLNNSDLILKKLLIIKDLQELNIIDTESYTDTNKYDDIYIDANDIKKINLKKKILNLDDVINGKIIISKEYVKVSLNILESKKAPEKLINKMKKIEQLQNNLELISSEFTSFDEYDSLTSDAN
jgi:hypothetical protein